MSRQDILLELIASAYDAALVPDLWPQLLDRLGDAVGGPSVNLGIFDPESGLMKPLAPRMPPEHASSYVAHWAPLNPLWQKSAREPPGKMFRPADFMPVDDFRRTTFYQEWWSKVGFDTEPVATNLLVDGAASAVLSCHSQPGFGPIGADGRRLFAQFVPHAIRAVELYRRVHRIAFTNEQALRGLDELHQGFLLLDGRGRVLFSNQVAQELLAQADGLKLDGGAVAAAKPEASATLRAAVASSASRKDDRDAGLTVGARLSLPRPGRPPLDVIVMPLRPHVADTHMSWMVRPRPMAIVLISDAERAQRALRAGIRQRFGLTAAEAAFALEISRGDGRAAAARRLNITVATARTHLSRIFEKTGARRQAELIRLLMNGNGGPGLPGDR